MNSSPHDAADQVHPLKDSINVTLDGCGCAQDGWSGGQGDNGSVCPSVIRPYEQRDADATALVFQAAIRATAAVYYAPEQVEAWAGGAIDLERWDRSRSAAWTLVAELDGAVVGFSDLTSDGELGMLFVHPDAGGRGIARQLVTEVLAEGRRRGLSVIRTHASRAARPAFERFGFVMDAENRHNTTRGVVVPNSDMHIAL